MKHVISKAVALMLCCFMIIGFAACDRTKNPDPTEKPANTAETTEPATENPTEVPSDPTEEPTKPPEDPTEPPENPTPEPVAEVTKPEDFSMDVVNYLISNGYAGKSFIMSPTSFRAALCLAIAGADGETKDQLLKSAGFDTIEEASTWYASLLDKIKEFEIEHNDSLEYYEEAPDRAFQIANAVWNNSSISKDFKDTYVEYVKEHYDAEAKSSPKETITDDVNEWCEEKTNGMIKKAAPDLSECTAALINALYVKNTWIEPFFEGATQKDVFHCVGGKTTEVEFMNRTDYMRYYKDSQTQLVVLPLFGGMDFICVIGSTEGINEKLANLETAKVHVMIPKLDITSRFENSELVNYLHDRGVVLPFTDSADFSEMKEDGSEPWYIDDIMQVAKIKTDEHGLEAAAVTIISVKAAGIEVNVEPEEFIANVPFFFMITSGDYTTGNHEVLFFGQMAGTIDNAE